MDPLQDASTPTCNLVFEATLPDPFLLSFIGNNRRPILGTATHKIIPSDKGSLFIHSPQDQLLFPMLFGSEVGFLVSVSKSGFIFMCLLKQTESYLDDSDPNFWWPSKLSSVFYCPRSILLAWWPFCLLVVICYVHSEFRSVSFLESKYWTFFLLVGLAGVALPWRVFEVMLGNKYYEIKSTHVCYSIDCSCCHASAAEVDLRMKFNCGLALDFAFRSPATLLETSLCFCPQQNSWFQRAKASRGVEVQFKF